VQSKNSTILDELFKKMQNSEENMYNIMQNDINNFFRKKNYKKYETNEIKTNDIIKHFDEKTSKTEKNEIKKI
jgi:chaperone required for assembly of F1-ATPase